MSISHESWDIGTVRRYRVSAAPGVGATQLRFSLEWTLHSKRENDYSVFGTYVRVAVAQREQRIFCTWDMPCRKGRGLTKLVRTCLVASRSCIT